jgi:hypothetical protein
MIQWWKGGVTMRDFPVFTTEHGVGSLIFKEIPSQGAAFVKIHDALEPDEFLMECVSFARAAGAERVYACGNVDLSEYPFHTSILRMRICREELDDTDASLFPVTEECLQDFRHIYNQRMKYVPNFSFMTEKDALQMLNDKEGYFIHRDGILMGIGMAKGSEIKTVISCVPGAGRDVVLALNHALAGDTAELDVASENGRAIRLYESMGFIKIQELSKWYKIY